MWKQHLVSKETWETQCTGLICNTTGKSGSHVVAAAAHYLFIFMFSAPRSVLICSKLANKIQQPPVCVWEAFCLCLSWQFFFPTLYLEFLPSDSQQRKFVRYMAKSQNIAEGRGKSCHDPAPHGCICLFVHFRVGLTVNRKCVSLVVFRTTAKCSHHDVKGPFLFSLPV